jgi:hypothetical protein
VPGTSLSVTGIVAIADIRARTGRCQAPRVVACAVEAVLDPPLPEVSGTAMDRAIPLAAAGRQPRSVGVPDADPQRRLGAIQVSTSQSHHAFDERLVPEKASASKRQVP